MKPTRPSRNPDKCTPESLQAFAVTMRRLPFWGPELTCNQCGDVWIPRRIGTEFGYNRVRKLGDKLEANYWLCGNGCNQHIRPANRRKEAMNQDECIFKPVTIGRAIELAEAILGADPQEGQIEALLELLAGITDETGCPIRHNAAATVMRYVSNMQSNAWMDEVERLQASTIAASAI